MKPTEINIMVASLSNYLYECMPRDDFECLALFLNELSKSMFTMTVFERLCDNDKKHSHTIHTHSTHVDTNSDDESEEAELLQAEATEDAPAGEKLL